MVFIFCMILESYCIISDEKTIISGEKRAPPSLSTSDPIYPDSLIPTPCVKIMVESPKEPPNNEFGLDLTSTIVSQTIDTVINIEEPIDVNEQRDTSNIFYDYTVPDEITDLRNRNLTRQITEETSDLDEINVVDDDNINMTDDNNDDNNHDADHFDQQPSNEPFVEDTTYAQEHNNS